MPVQKLVIVDSKTERKLIDDQKSIISKYDVPYDVKTGEPGILYKYYRDPYYFYVNFLLRENRMPTLTERAGRIEMSPDEILDIINKMDYIFSIVPALSNPIIVYRGVALDDVKSYKTSNQFKSTSFSPHQAFKHLVGGARCCLFKISVPAGTKVIITDNKQQEVILGRNTTLNITSTHAIKTQLPISMYDANAITGPFISAGDFIEDLKRRRETKSKVVSERRLDLKSKRSKIDNVLEELSDELNINDGKISREEGLEFASNLGISYEDFKELIMVTDVEDALEELKQKYNKFI